MAKKKKATNTPQVEEVKTISANSVVLMINKSKRTADGIKPNKSIQVKGSMVEHYKSYGFVIPGEAIVQVEETEEVETPEVTEEEMKAKLIDWGFAEEELEGMTIEEMKKLYEEQKAENEVNLDE